MRFLLPLNFAFSISYSHEDELKLFLRTYYTDRDQTDTESIKDLAMMNSHKWMKNLKLHCRQNDVA